MFSRFHRERVRNPITRLKAKYARLSEPVNSMYQRVLIFGSAHPVFAVADEADSCKICGGRQEVLSPWSRRGPVPWTFEEAIAHHVVAALEDNSFSAQFHGCRNLHRWRRLLLITPLIL